MSAPRIIKDAGLFAFDLPQPKRDARRSVFFLPSDDGGCGWLRCLLPALGLSECTEWQAGGAWGLRYTEAQIARHDVVVFQRQGNGPALRNMIRAKARGQTVVYEIDDYALMTPDNPHTAAPLRNTTATRSFILACMREADLVTVTTPALARAYARFNPHIAVLPNCTHPAVNCSELARFSGAGRIWEEALTLRSPAAAGERSPPPSPLSCCGRRGAGGEAPHPPSPLSCHSRKRAGGEVPDRVTVAYAAALAHREDAALLRAVIPSVAARYPGADFLFFGDWPHGEWVPDLPHTYRMDFLPIRAYYHALQLFDIGLAPLRLNQFTLHKSNLKALDYLGAGMAPVLQDHPIYDEFIHGVHCLKAKTGADWIRRIGLLIRSPGLREELVDNGQAMVRKYDYRAHAQRWARAYEEAICRRSRTR